MTRANTSTVSALSQNILLPLPHSSPSSSYSEAAVSTAQIADPLSIVTSTVGLVDISIRVIKFINTTKKGIDTIDEDLRQLVTEVERLKYASELIQKAFEDDMKEGGTVPKGSTDNIWSAASFALIDCRAALKRLNSLLEQIKGEDGSSTFDRLRRHFTKLSKDEDFSQLRQRLDRGYQVLQLSLAALNMFVFHPWSERLY